MNAGVFGIKSSVPTKLNKFHTKLDESHLELDKIL